MKDDAEAMLYRDFAVLSRSNSDDPYATPALEALGDAIKQLSQNIESTSGSPTTPPAPAPSGVHGIIPSGVDNTSAGSDQNKLLPSTALQELPFPGGPALSSDSGARGILTEVMTGLWLPSLPGQPIASNDTAGEGNGFAGTALSVATTVLKSGLGLTPVLRTLFGLFSGDGEADTTPLLKYALPSSLHFNAATGTEGTANIDYDQAGLPRAYSEESASESVGPASQVTVNIQALDARSFLDRSTEIAAAVKEAMLNMNSINDVIMDL